MKNMKNITISKIQTMKNFLQKHLGKIYRTSRQSGNTNDLFEYKTDKEKALFRKQLELYREAKNEIEWIRKAILHNQIIKIGEEIIALQNN